MELLLKAATKTGLPEGRQNISSSMHMCLQTHVFCAGLPTYNILKILTVRETHEVWYMKCCVLQTLPKR
jgi:hypothetical protein